MHKVETAKKLMELATPTINKILSDGVSESELKEAMMIVELAHYLCEFEIMEDELRPHGDKMSDGRAKSY